MLVAKTGKSREIRKSRRFRRVHDDAPGQPLPGPRCPEKDLRGYRREGRGRFLLP